LQAIKHTTNTKAASQSLTFWQAAF